MPQPMPTLSWLLPLTLPWQQAHSLLSTQLLPPWKEVFTIHQSHTLALCPLTPSPNTSPLLSISATPSPTQTESPLTPGILTL